MSKIHDPFDMKRFQAGEVALSRDGTAFRYVGTNPTRPADSNYYYVAGRVKDGYLKTFNARGQRESSSHDSPTDLIYMLNSKLIPFNLERFMAGAVAVARNGDRVTYVRNEAGIRPTVCALPGGFQFRIGSDGRQDSHGKDSPYDLLWTLPIDPASASAAPPRDTTGLRPFNLARFEAGEPALTRDGMMVMQFVGINPAVRKDSDQALVAVNEEGHPCTYCMGGLLRAGESSHSDLTHMAPGRYERFVVVKVSYGGNGIAVERPVSQVYQSEEEARAALRNFVNAAGAPDGTFCTIGKLTLEY